MLYWIIVLSCFSRPCFVIRVLSQLKTSLQLQIDVRLSTILNKLFACCIDIFLLLGKWMDDVDFSVYILLLVVGPPVGNPFPNSFTSTSSFFLNFLLVTGLNSQVFLPIIQAVFQALSSTGEHLRKGMNFEQPLRALVLSVCVQLCVLVQIA